MRNTCCILRAKSGGEIEIVQSKKPCACRRIACCEVGREERTYGSKILVMTPPQNSSVLRWSLRRTLCIRCASSHQFANSYAHRNARLVCSITVVEQFISSCLSCFMLKESFIVRGSITISLDWACFWSPSRLCYIRQLAVLLQVACHQSIESRWTETCSV